MGTHPIFESDFDCLTDLFAMNLLPKHGSDFASKDYWKDFFNKRKDPFEWYGTYFELAYILNRYVKKQDEILMVGCGNSELSDELYSRNDCKLITNIDISENVIERMKEKSKQNGREMIYEVGDVTKMKYSDESFNVVIDKGTLDAMMVDEKEETKCLIDKMFVEIERCIKNNGRYVVITLAQTHIAKHLINHFSQRAGWMVRLHEHTPAAKESEAIPLPVFIFCLTRMKPIGERQMPKIMEVFGANAEKGERVGAAEMSLFIKSKQEWSQLKGHVQKLRPSSDEVNFTLFSAAVAGVPRFNLFVLDAISNTQEMAFFIVQNGREFEWIYSTKAGRQSLAEACKQIVPGGYKRLVVVLLNAAHEYGSLDDVKGELSWLVAELKAANFVARSVPFLTESNELGERNTLYMSESDINGKFFVEESTSDDGNGKKMSYRRLVMHNQPTIVRSECRTKTEKIKTGKGKNKKTKTKCVYDCNYIASEYWFGIIVSLEYLKGENVLLLGLSGGALANYLQAKFPRSQITAVESDAKMLDVATTYFHFKKAQNSKVQICDEIEFARTMTQQVELLIVDVANKNAASPLKFPAPEFLETEMLERIRDCLADGGMAVINLICRDRQKRAAGIANCKKVFPEFIVMTCEQEDNNILLLSKTNVREGLMAAAKSIGNSIDQSDREKLYFMLSRMT